MLPAMRSKKNYNPVILPDAIDDMQFAALWYDKQQKGLGKVFLTRIKERVRKLKPNPYTCQVRYKNVHTALVNQFPYMIHYTIDETTRLFFIVAILHTSQNPQIWDDRTKEG
jgi:hypothetical protein